MLENEVVPDSDNHKCTHPFIRHEQGAFEEDNKADCDDCEQALPVSADGRIIFPPGAYVREVNSGKYPADFYTHRVDSYGVERVLKESLWKRAKDTAHELKAAS